MVLMDEQETMRLVVFVSYLETGWADGKSRGSKLSDLLGPDDYEDPTYKLVQAGLMGRKAAGVALFQINMRHGFLVSANHAPYLMQAYMHMK